METVQKHLNHFKKLLHINERQQDRLCIKLGQMLQTLSPLKRFKVVSKTHKLNS